MGFEVQEQADSGTSPSGELPALELQGEVAPGKGAGDIVRRLDEAALGGALDALDLDARLSPEQQADLAAFQALVGASLAEATLWITWGDVEAYTRHTRAAYSSRLPAPLSYLVPRGQRKQVLRDLERRGSDSAAGALRLAARAYQALDAKLAAGGGARYFFGDRPSSLDAAVLAHVLFHRTAPVSPQALREELGKYPHLVKYCDRLATEVFNTPRAKPLPMGEGVRPEAGASSGGRERGGGAWARPPPRRTLSTCDSAASGSPWPSPSLQVTSSWGTSSMLSFWTRLRQSLKEEVATETNELRRPLQAGCADRVGPEPKAQIIKNAIETPYY